MKTSEFDRQFNEGQDVTRFLDISKARRVKQDQKRINVDIPIWMIEALDRQARRMGVTRQSIIKIWLAERLEHTNHNLESGESCVNDPADK